MRQLQVFTPFELSVLAFYKLLTNKFVLNLLPNFGRALVRAEWQDTDREDRLSACFCMPTSALLLRLSQLNVAMDASCQMRLRPGTRSARSAVKAQAAVSFARYLCKPDEHITGCEQVQMWQ